MSTLTGVCCMILVEDCHYKSSLQLQGQLECWTKLTGTLLKSVFEEEDCIRQCYVDCMCSTDVLRACGRNSARRWKASHVNRAAHLIILVQGHYLSPK